MSLISNTGGGGLKTFTLHSLIFPPFIYFHLKIKICVICLETSTDLFFFHSLLLFLYFFETRLPWDLSETLPTWSKYIKDTKLKFPLSSSMNHNTEYDVIFVCNIFLYSLYLQKIFSLVFMFFLSISWHDRNFFVCLHTQHRYDKIKKIQQDWNERRLTEWCGVGFMKWNLSWWRNFLRCSYSLISWTAFEGFSWQKYFHSFSYSWRMCFNGVNLHFFCFLSIMKFCYMLKI